MESIRTNAKTLPPPGLALSPSGRGFPLLPGAHAAWMCTADRLRQCALRCGSGEGEEAEETACGHVRR